MDSSKPINDGLARKARLILVYGFFVLINIVVNRIVVHMGLPLYVDNIGTILGAVYGVYFYIITLGAVCLSGQVVPFLFLKVYFLVFYYNQRLNLIENLNFYLNISASLFIFFSIIHYLKQLSY